MSYGFNLIFAKCKSDTDILNAYKSIKSVLLDKFKKNPEPFVYGLPENKGYYSMFLKSVFIFKIYHWKNLDLMAVLYNNLSAGFDVNFKSEIYFQKYNADNPQEYKFSGNRIHRGMYQCANGQLINADVNGALNILRKSSVVSLKALYSRGEVDTPIRIRVA